MQSVVGRNEERRRSGLASSAVKESNTSITMYGEPPSEDISLEDFESFALDRLAGAIGLLRAPGA